MYISKFLLECIINLSHPLLQLSNTNLSRKLLVLDEATAALDNESEKIVQKALDKMQETNPRTTLTVAHRLETVKKCDKIVVLNKGGVQEEGTHDELLALNGLYHSLWTKQSGGQ